MNRVESAQRASALSAKKRNDSPTDAMPVIQALRKARAVLAEIKPLLGEG